MSEANHELQNEVAGLIVSTLNLDVSPEKIQPDASLYGEGLGLDSIDILEVALVVSKRFGFQLRADNADNIGIFSSLASLTRHIAANQTKMSFTLLRAVRWIVIAAAAIAYPVLAHYSAATSAATTLPSLGVAVSLAPSLAILLVADLAFAHAAGHVAPVRCRGRAAVGVLGRAGTQFQLGLFPSACRHLCHAGRRVRRHPRHAGGKLCAPGLPKRSMAAWRRTKSVIRARSRWRGRCFYWRSAWFPASCSFLPASRSGRFSPISSPSL